MPKHWVSPRCASCGYPVASSAGLCPCKSLRLVAAPQHRFRLFDGLGCQSVHAALVRPVQEHQRCMVSASQYGSQSAVALDVGHGSLRIVAGMPVPPSVVCCSFGHTLRFYIRPHCVKWSPVSREAPLVSSTASRPAGLRSRHYAKWPTLVRACQPSALPGLSQPYAPPTVALVLCWRSGFSQLLRKCFWSVACGHASCVCPAHPGASPRCAWHWPGAVCPSAPRGLPQNRAGVRVRGLVHAGASRLLSTNLGYRW